MPLNQNNPLPPGGKEKKYQLVWFGGKKWKKRKGENLKEKGIKGKEKDKSEVKGKNKCKVVNNYGKKGTIGVKKQRITERGGKI
jgi:hypothetical protein